MQIFASQRAPRNSQLLIPFFALVMHQTATNHLSNPSGLSSKIVPTLALNWRRGCFSAHCQRRLIFEVRDVHRSAVRANDTIRPAHLREIVGRDIGVREKLDGFDQCFRICIFGAHAGILAARPRLVKYIIAQIS